MWWPEPGLFQQCVKHDVPYDVNIDIPWGLLPRSQENHLLGSLPTFGADIDSVLGMPTSSNCHPGSTSIMGCQPIQSWVHRHSLQAAAKNLMQSTRIISPRAHFKPHSHDMLHHIWMYVVTCSFIHVHVYLHMQNVSIRYTIPEPPPRTSCRNNVTMS